MSFCKSACLSVSQSICQSIDLCVSNFHIISLLVSLIFSLSLFTIFTVLCACLYSFLPFSGTSVTALDFGPPVGLDCSSWILAAGSELGDINFWILNKNSADLLGTIDTLYSHGSTVKKLSWTPSSILIPFSIDSYSELHSSTLPSNTSSSIPSTINHISSNVTLPILPSSTFVSSDKLEINSNIRSEVNPPVSIWRLASCGEDHTVRIFQISQ